jgi:hypothetical protein
MRRHPSWWGTWIVLALLCSADVALGESPLTMLVPFKRVDADPSKSYEVTQDHGPWLILAASFSGEGAEKQAHELVMELRSSFKLKAYTNQQHYDYSQSVSGLGLNRYGEAKKMKHSHSNAYDVIAVLIGNFTSIDDPNLEKTLQKIKYAKPNCLDIQRNKNSTQSYVRWRTMQRLVSNDQEKKTKGPMGSAFATRNPLLPDEYFSARGVDPLVVEMNKEAEYSLLKNPAKYTVKVATFGGFSTMKLDEIERLARSNGRTKLEDAAFKAHQLTVALRKQGVEAYEFHDRTESLVTVGAFDSVGKPLSNGSTEFNPAVCEILKRYGAEQKMIPGQNVVGLQPKSVVPGIPMDIQPIPIEVPRISVAASYSRTRALD